MPAIQFEPILSSVPMPMLVECRERIVYANQSYATLLGFDSPSGLIGRHVSGLVAGLDRNRLLEFGRLRAQGQHAPAEYPFAARCRDGHIRLLRAEVSSTVLQCDCYITTLVRPIERPSHPGGSLSRLSIRESTVFDLLTQRKRPKEIALLLQISPKTVCTLQARMMRKLGVTDLWELLQLASRERIRDPQRLAVLHRTGLLDTPAEEVFDRITRLTARVLNAPVAFVSLVDEERDFYKSSTGFNAATRELTGETFCHHALLAERTLAIHNTRADAVYRRVPTVESWGVASYLGAPLRLSGETLGALCVVDFEPHQWTSVQVELLEEFAALIVRELELREAATPA